MTGRFYSAVLGVLAGGCGIGLYHFDNWYETLSNTWLKTSLDYSEMLLMGPGIGILIWMLAERVRLRDDWHQRSLRHEQDERFLMLGRIAASVAHELRNPLQIMRLVAEELRATEPTRDIDLLNRLDHSLARLDQTVMLAYELARPMRTTNDADGVEINLCVLMGEVLTEIERRHGIPLQIEHFCPVPAPRVVAREHALRIVVSNLLRNALEAAAGQSVSIRYEGGTVIRLFIRNLGCMPDKLLAGDNLATSSKPGGLGIGIAIARHLCGAMGGTITFSNLDGFAQTCVTLPSSSGPKTMEDDHAENPAGR